MTMSGRVSCSGASSGTLGVPRSWGGAGFNCKVSRKGASVSPGLAFIPEITGTQEPSAPRPSRYRQRKHKATKLKKLRPLSLPNVLEHRLLSRVSMWKEGELPRTGSCPHESRGHPTTHTPSPVLRPWQSHGLWKQLSCPVAFQPHKGAWMCFLSPEGGHRGVAGGSSSSPEHADTSPWSRVPAVACWHAQIIPPTAPPPN